MQLPVTQDQQLIGEGQHIGLVGNQDQRSLQGFQPGNRLQQRLLSRVVQIGIGLVEDDHGGQAVHGTRQPDALLLPTGQPGAAVAQHGVVPLWQLQDQFMDARHLRSGQHLVGIDLCKAALERLYTCRESLDFAVKNASADVVDDEQLLSDIAAHRDRFIEAMDDDLNTADGLSAVFELVKDINTRILDKNVSKHVCETAAGLFDELCNVLGILYNRKSNDVDSEIEALIEKRQEARKNKDFATADKIRDELKAKGIILKDTPQGVTWTKE